MCGVNVGIMPGFLDRKNSELRNAVICMKRGPDFDFSRVDIRLQNNEMCSTRVTDGLLGCALIMLATLGHVYMR